MTHNSTLGECKKEDNSITGFLDKDNRIRFRGQGNVGVWEKEKCVVIVECFPWGDVSTYNNSDVSNTFSKFSWNTWKNYPYSRSRETSLYRHTGECSWENFSFALGGSRGCPWEIFPISALVLFRDGL